MAGGTKKRKGKPKLKPPQKAALRKASVDGIQARMPSVATHFKSSGWLPPDNSYLLKTVKKIDLQAKSSPPRFRNRPLSDYIAVSCTLHCIDGWSYLARAFNALVQGDAGAARHLGYYAELRAAMSLLASQGTGVFSSNHVLVDDSSICYPFSGPGTHNAVWMFLEYWGERKGANTVLNSIVSPGNRPLADWVTAFGAGTVTPKLIAQEWCKLWGLDLKRLSKDRDARNESSYRPTQLSNPAGLPAQEAAAFVAEFWKIFRPWPPNFGVLDAYLLRKILQETFVSSRGLPVTSPDFRARVTQMLDQVQPTGMTVPWTEFLEDTAEPLLQQYAGRDEDPTGPNHHIQVISRAALLLRMASGTSEKLFDTVGISEAAIDFWSSRFGVVRGIWQSGGQPADMLDLWQDVEEALDGLNAWRAENDPNVSYSNLRREQVAQLQVLCECERIALWGITP
jgi:hypothetical protein